MKNGGRVPVVERRSGVDRRKGQKKEYAGIERRTQLEPRKPEVQEVEVSDSEWAKLFKDASPRSK